MKSNIFQHFRVTFEAIVYIRIRRGLKCLKSHHWPSLRFLHWRWPRELMRKSAAFPREDTTSGNARGLPSLTTSFLFHRSSLFFFLPSSLFSPFLLVHAFSVSKHVAAEWKRKKKSCGQKERQKYFSRWFDWSCRRIPESKDAFQVSLFLYHFPSLHFSSSVSLSLSLSLSISLFLFFSLSTRFFVWVNTGIPQRDSERPEKYSLRAVQGDSIDDETVRRWFFDGNPFSTRMTEENHALLCTEWNNARCVWSNTKCGIQVGTRNRNVEGGMILSDIFWVLRYTT